MPAGITITVAPSFENISKAFASVKIDDQINEYIKEYALWTERYSKQVTPVDTGRLRSSINTLLFPSRKMAVVGTNVEYAIFVHEGTRRMRPRPFMKLGEEFAGRKMGGDKLASRLDKHLREKLSKL